MCRKQKIGSCSFVLMRSTLLASRGSVFSAGFALSADNQKIVKLVCGRSAEVDS